MTDRMSDEFLTRRWKLHRACRLGNPTLVDGITFDLNHPDLDRDEWEAVDILGEFPGMGLEPAIVYPWTSEDMAQRLISQKSAVVLVPGDRVTISRVEKFDSVKMALGKLDHPHHRERRLVHLAVMRGDGPPIAVPDFWLFAGVADVITPIFLNQLTSVRYALIARLERLCGMQDLDDALMEVAEADWNARFANFEDEVRLAAKMLWKAEDYQDHAGMAFGYLIGRAEAREGRQLVSKSASKGPRRTGDQTRWAAIALIDETPGIILQRCAEKVAVLTDKSVKSVTKTLRTSLFREMEDGAFKPDPEKVEAFRRTAKTGP